MESRILYTVTDGCQRQNLASLNVFLGGLFRSANYTARRGLTSSGFIVGVSLGT